MVPQATDDGYEGFEEMIERTNTWLKDQCDILVVNMQSIMVQKDDDGTSAPGSNRRNTLSLSVDVTLAELNSFGSGSEAGKITAGLAESSGSLRLG